MVQLLLNVAQIPWKAFSEGVCELAAQRPTGEVIM